MGIVRGELSQMGIVRGGGECPKTFRCICVNCFHRFKFLAEVSTKLHEMHLFRQFKDHNSGRKHKYQTNDPIFFIYFFLSVFNLTFTFVFENSQNSFSCGPLFGPFWSVKYLNFGQKLPFGTAHHTFLERRKFMFCSPVGAKKWYQLMD